MKKIALILGLVLTLCSGAQASDYGISCGTNPYRDSLGFSNITGLNFVSEKIASAIILKEIGKVSKGKYKVDLQSYNVSSLKQGIFKSLEITGKDTITDEIYISNVKFKTLCDYNYLAFNQKDKTVTFKENFYMTFALQFTEEDLINTMQNNRQYQELIRRANSIGNTTKLFNIVSTSAKIENNKLYYVIKIAVPLLKKKPEVVIETDMRARAGEIVISEAKLVTGNFKVDMGKLEKLLNYLNPLEFALDLFEEKQATTKVHEISINNNTINVAGIVSVAKDVVVEE